MRVSVNGCAEALPVLEQAVDVIRQTWPADDELLGVGSAQLGACLAQAKHVQEAERLLLDGHRILHSSTEPLPRTP